MSHTQTVKVAVRDVLAFKETNDHDDIKGNIKDADGAVTGHVMFDGKKVTGRMVHFKNWNYPVIFSEDGEAHYDDYGGRWGKPEDLHRWTQRYAATAARNAAVQDGHMHLRTSKQGDDLLCVTAKDGAEVHMTFPLNGEAKVEVQNCSGHACEGLTNAITAAIGTVTSTMVKEEWHERERLRETE